MLENMRKTVKKWKQQILIKQETCLFLEQNITLRSNNSLIDQLTWHTDTENEHGPLNR